MRTVAPYEMGITVEDLDRELAFYAGVLGLRVVSEIDVPGEKSAWSGLAPEGYRIVRLETPSGERLKLARPARAPEDVPPASWAMQRRGAAYLTFIVDDLDALHVRLVERGVDVRSRGKVEVRPGLWLVLVADPEGNYVEFLQYADLHAYRPRPGAG